MSEVLEQIELPIVEIVPDQWGSFKIVLLCIGVTLLQNILFEIILWYNVYSHEEYNDLIDRTRNLGRKLKTLKDAQLYGRGGSKERQNVKMIKVQEDNYKGYHRQMQGVSTLSYQVFIHFIVLQWRARTTMATSFLSMGIMYQVNSYFKGTICGRLPFEPYGFVTSMSHRGLTGDDNQLVSLTFIMILANMAFRGMIPKLAGIEAPRLPVEQQAPKWMSDYIKQE